MCTPRHNSSYASSVVSSKVASHAAPLDAIDSLKEGGCTLPKDATESQGIRSTRRVETLKEVHAAP